MKLSHQANKRNGFTLVELLIVIVVIAILAAIGTVSYNGVMARAHDTTVKSNISNAGKNILTYEITEGAFPTSPNELRDLVTVNSRSYNGTNRFVYCWRGGDVPRFAIAGRSKSGTGFYYSSRDGMQELESWSNSITTMCNAMGITQPGHPNGSQWYREWGYTNNWAWWVDVR